MGYLDERLKESQEYEAQQAQAPKTQYSFGSEDKKDGSSAKINYTPTGDATGDAGGMAMAAGMSSGNPYAIGAGFLLSYLAQKKKEEAAKRQAAIAAEQNYEENQNKGLNQLGSYWARALGR